MAQNRTLLIVGLATLVVLAVFSILVATIGPTIEDFHAGASSQTWALGGMSLGMASALLTIGAVADRAGRRRVFALSSALLAVTTVLGAVAPGIEIFVAARVLEGVAGAGVLAAGLGLVGHAFPSPLERTRATGVWGAMLGAGIALGPLAAALLARAFDWRASYWAFGLAAGVLALSALTLDESKPAGEARRFDPAGALSIAVAMTALTAGLTSGRSSWTSAATVTLLVGGVAALGAFVATEARRDHPLLDLELFRGPLFVASLSGAAITGLATVGLMSHLTIVLTSGLSRSLLAAAGVLAVWSVTSVVVAFQSRRLPAHVGASDRLVAGLVASGVGTAMLADLDASSSWVRLVPGLVIAGVGSGLANAALGRLAVESVPAADAALGSGANNTARYLGSALGIALVAVLITGGGSGAGGLVDGWDHAALVGAGLNLAGAAWIGLATRRGGSIQAGVAHAGRSVSGGSGGAF